MGELLQGIFKEATGSDEKNRRAAGLPFNMAATDFTIRSWGAVGQTFTAGLDMTGPV